MSNESDNDKPDYLSPKDIREWAQQEILNTSKAAELRTKELTSLMEDYSAGRISAEKADEMQSLYYHRWGEALPGISAIASISDEQIVASIDKAAAAVNGPFITPAETHSRFVERTRPTVRGVERNQK
jgi:hypothetical protein